jgi:hypothetical protein
MFNIDSMKPMDSMGVVIKKITVSAVWTGRLLVDFIG